MATAMIEDIQLQTETSFDADIGTDLPGQPAEILGFNILALQRLGFLAIDAGIASPGLGPKLYALPQAANLLELAMQVKQTRKVRFEDIEAHRSDITALNPRARFAFRFAQNEHLRNWMMGKINQELPGHVDTVMEQATLSMESIRDLQEKVELIASFENPRAQFEQEVNDLADTVHDEILEQRDLRVTAGVQSQLETPTGIKGFFVKALRKVKRFFGFFKRNNQSSIEDSVSAYDVGSAVAIVYKKLADKDVELLGKIPMISGMVGDYAQKFMSKVTPNNIAFGAPEVLQFFVSLSQDKAKWRSLIRSVETKPHEFRFVTKYVTGHNGFSLPVIQNVANNLLPAIKTVLPTNSAIIRQAYADIQQLLSPAPMPVANVSETGSPFTLKQAMKQIARDKKASVVSKFKTRVARFKKSK